MHQISNREIKAGGLRHYGELKIAMMKLWWQSMNRMLEEQPPFSYSMGIRRLLDSCLQYWQYYWPTDYMAEHPPEPDSSWSHGSPQIHRRWWTCFGPVSPVQPLPCLDVTMSTWIYAG
jgi:hypothetical protein